MARESDAPRRDLGSSLRPVHADSSFAEASSRLSSALRCSLRCALTSRRSSRRSGARGRARGFRGSPRETAGQVVTCSATTRVGFSHLLLRETRGTRACPEVGDERYGWLRKREAACEGPPTVKFEPQKDRRPENAPPKDETKSPARPRTAVVDRRKTIKNPRLTGRAGVWIGTAARLRSKGSPPTGACEESSAVEEPDEAVFEPVETINRTGPTEDKDPRSRDPVDAISKADAKRRGCHACGLPFTELCSLLCSSRGREERNPAVPSPLSSVLCLCSGSSRSAGSGLSM